MSKKNFKQYRLILTSISIALLLTACGGGGSSSDTAENSTKPSTAADSGRSAAESRYKTIAGEWKGALEGLGRNGDEEKEFTFTIDLNGVGRIKGELLYVFDYTSEKNRFTLSVECKTGPSDCKSSIFAKCNSDDTRITEVFLRLWAQS